MLLSFAFEMKGELLAQLAFDATWSDHRAQAKFQVANIHPRYASFITRPMALAMRSHSLASIASCRRPDAVSR